MLERESDYSPDEKKVCAYLQKIASDVGCGADPIAFLIASHAAISAIMKCQDKTINTLRNENSYLKAEMDARRLEDWHQKVEKDLNS